MEFINNRNISPGIKFSTLTVLFFVFFYQTLLSQAIIVEPVGKKIADQSFPASFKYFENVEFATFSDYKNSPPSVNFYLMRDSMTVYRFPDHYGNENWAFEDIIAVSFKDLNDDGLKDIIIMANYITGVGPSGMEPFKVIDVYFQFENGFQKNSLISENLNNEDNFELLKTIKSIVIHVRSIFNNGMGYE